MQLVVFSKSKYLKQTSTDSISCHADNLTALFGSIWNYEAHEKCFKALWTLWCPFIIDISLSPTLITMRCSQRTLKTLGKLFLCIFASWQWARQTLTQKYRFFTNKSNFLGHLFFKQLSKIASHKTKLINWLNHSTTFVKPWLSLGFPSAF